MHRTIPLVLLLACALEDQTDTPLDSSPDADTDTGTAPAEVEPPPPWPADRTGEATWTALEGTFGALVDHEPRKELSWDAAGLSILMGVGGLGELTPVPYGVESHRFTYETQDRGTVVEATALLTIPDGEAPEGGWPVILGIHHFAGLAGTCSPSEEEFFALQYALLASSGFVVIAPDITGLDGLEMASAPHAPLVGDQVAWSAWDGVRAGRALLAGDLAETVGPEGVRDDILLWGGSQGGHGVLWAELSAPYLAPEETIRGMVSIVPPIDVRSALEVAFGSNNGGTGLGGLVVLGMARWYDAFDWLEDVFLDEAPDHLRSTLVAAAQAPTESCSADVDVDVDDVDDALVPGFLDAMNTETSAAPWKAVLDEQGVTTSSVPRLANVPTLMIFGEEDDVVATMAQSDAVAALCDQMDHLEIRTCAGADHAEAAIWTIPEVLDWLRARLDDPGAPTAPSCGLPVPTRCSATPDDVVTD